MILYWNTLRLVFILGSLNTKPLWFSKGNSTYVLINQRVKFHFLENSSNPFRFHKKPFHLVNWIQKKYYFHLDSCDYSLLLKAPLTTRELMKWMQVLHTPLKKNNRLYSELIMCLIGVNLFSIRTILWFLTNWILKHCVYLTCIFLHLLV